MLSPPLPKHVVARLFGLLFLIVLFLLFLIFLFRSGFAVRRLSFLGRRRLRLLLVFLFGLRAVGAYNVLDGFEGGSGAAGFGDQDFAILVHSEDATGGALGHLLEADRLDQGGLGVAQKRVRQVLLLLERGVGFGRVRRKAIDSEATGGQGLVVVAEEADLVRAYAKILRLATSTAIVVKAHA